ncbi:dolichyl-phosphate-mannose--protein mannosyltransferase [Schumannella sp. 10F1B-5-1]|uniref:dolichyl-phosphate-mannose--protein mannosyltransferase n=1 Tax=Schumannella sp. 10F1B-5-1 TaxID=2590780 RepID=UPI0011325DC3|nr:phospholipid carrier-dependent glycosyltransferase [Schumannella sp. 10F1B-5-1]TPW72987.1 phospholipid carrier-dependent glycosyltransferase [Schumannella sp. 10F1B-5-1]
MTDGRDETPAPAASAASGPATAETPTATPAPDPDADFARIALGYPAEPIAPLPVRQPPGPATRFDAWWRAKMSEPRWSLLWTWGGPGLVMLVAVVTRLVALSQPHALVFDETYYAKDAWSLLHLGYEGSWSDGDDARFLAGDTDVYTDVPSFVAHPPLGKWVIALGLMAFGAQDAIGWRISVAIVGILLVALTMAVARGLFHSRVITVLSGGLLAIDGNAIVMSRVALLDIVLALFCLLGVGAMLLDRRWARRRLEGWVIRRELGHRHTDWGPSLWWRPWMLAAAVAFGAASAVKWSGIWFLAILAIWSVVMDALDRRRAGVAFWPTSAALKQAPVSFLLLVPLAAAVHLASWTGWFVTDDGYDRHWIESGGGERWTGALSWVPTAFQNWYHYQASMYGFHVGESTPHSYQANPLTWLFLVRPTSMYYQESDGGASAAAITEIANPLIWWACTAALGFLVWRFIRTRDGAVGVLLVAIAAGYLPWMGYLHRTVFQFYTIVFEPFLVIGLAVALAHLLGRWNDPPGRRRVGFATVGTFLVLAVVLSAYWFPMWIGLPMPREFIYSHYWLRSWL